MSQGFTRSFGWVNKPEAARRYAATLPTGDDFWSWAKEEDARLTALLGTEDRYWYRDLVYGLTRAGDPWRSRWLKDRDGTLCLRSLNQMQVGSCVGHGEATRSSLIAACDAALRMEPEKVVGLHCPEWSYYASRKMGGMLNDGDGSTGSGAAEAAVAMGVLMKGTYGSVDCSEYSESRCRQWGKGQGIPSEATTEAAKHKCGRYIQVSTAEQCWLLAGVGVPWNQCSMLGWEGGDRDSDGIVPRGGQWPHSMCAGSSRRVTSGGKKVVLIHQSWGDDWVGGPYWQDMPFGSFYALLSDVAKAASEGDTFADVEYLGDMVDANEHRSATEM